MNQKKISLPRSILVLHNIRSVINVGAIFRTADAVGVNHTIISGYTPTPIDRFGRKRSDFIKASLGAEDSVSWEYTASIKKTLLSLKKDGYSLYAIEQSPTSKDYKSVKIKKKDKIVLLPGNEVTGVPAELLRVADHIIEIPMNGKKESLNISVATGIVLYRLLDR